MVQRERMVGRMKGRRDAQLDRQREAGQIGAGMDGWTQGRVDRQMDVSRDGDTDEGEHAWQDRCREGWMHRWVHKGPDAWTDRQLVGTDGPMGLILPRASMGQPKPSQCANTRAMVTS